MRYRQPEDVCWYNPVLTDTPFLVVLRKLVAEEERSGWHVESLQTKRKFFAYPTRLSVSLNEMEVLAWMAASGV